MSASVSLRCSSSWRWLRLSSCCLSLVSTDWILEFRAATCFSSSALSWMNFSFTSSILFFFITSVSRSISRCISSLRLAWVALFIAATTSAAITPPATKATIIHIQLISSVLFDVL